ncbi:hypothetical protein WNY78_09880 [Psychroserpens sp. AS72]|uniref:hypothetical protein n=1 Tax=Psychroserpens sp. AS72 TaxID=3135775 RepID=UPI00317B44D0
MNIPANLAKSSVLAFVIFWIIIGSKEINLEAMPFVMLSYIPIFLCVSIVIVGSICPFYWSAKNNTYTKVQVFKMCFPYYTCIAFGLCCYGIFVSDFDLYFSAFCMSAFITTNQSWVWFAKETNT